MHREIPGPNGKAPWRAILHWFFIGLIVGILGLELSAGR